MKCKKYLEEKQEERDRRAFEEYFDISVPQTSEDIKDRQDCVEETLLSMVNHVLREEGNLLRSCAQTGGFLDNLTSACLYYRPQFTFKDYSEAKRLAIKYGFESIKDIGR